MDDIIRQLFLCAKSTTEAREILEREMDQCRGEAKDNPDNSVKAQAIYDAANPAYRLLVEAERILKQAVKAHTTPGPEWEAVKDFLEK